MEGGGKRARSEKGTARQSLLDLARFIPQRDVRRLIWRHMRPYDMELVWCAQNERRPLPAFDPETLIAYAGAGYAQLIEWALAEREKLGAGQPPDWVMRSVAEAGARRGHTSVIQLADAPQPDYPRCCNKAARGGHLELVQHFMTDIHNPNIVCAYAARGGHTHVMEWVLANGGAARWQLYPKQAMVCAAAARYGQLDALKWARAHDFPWDERVRYHSSGETRQWALANGAP